MYTHRARGFYKTEYCAFCTENHSITNCPSFKVSDFKDHVSFVTENDLCFNRFGENLVTNCLFAQRCEYRKGMHHSLLHPHFSDIQLCNDKHHCSESGSLDSTEQILNEILQKTFCTSLASEQTFKSTFDTEPHDTQSCSALSISHFISESSEVIKQPSFISQNLLCARLEEDYNFEPKLETSQHDIPLCNVLISSIRMAKV